MDLHDKEVIFKARQERLAAIIKGELHLVFPKAVNPMEIASHACAEHSCALYPIDDDKMQRLEPNSLLRWST